MSERATVTFHTPLAAEEDFIAAVEEGLSDADAGLTIPHREAAAYLRSLGTDAPLPTPIAQATF